TPGGGRGGGRRDRRRAHGRGHPGVGRAGGGGERRAGRDPRVPPRVPGAVQVAEGDPDRRGAPAPRDGQGPPAEPPRGRGGAGVIASGSWGLAAFPLGAAAVATVFAWRLGARFARTRRAVEGHWTVALVMFAVASAAMFLGVARGWTAAEFRLYWLFGAVLNVPYLFLGELQLLVRNRVVSIVASVAIYALTVVAIVAIWRPPIHPAALGRPPPAAQRASGPG